MNILTNAQRFRLLGEGVTLLERLQKMSQVKDLINGRLLVDSKKIIDGVHYPSYAYCQLYLTRDGQYVEVKGYNDLFFDHGLSENAPREVPEEELVKICMKYGSSLPGKIANLIAQLGS